MPKDNKFSNRSYCLLLQQLSNDELKDIEVFLRLPSLKTTHCQRKVFAVLKKAHPRLNIRKEEIFQKCFPDILSAQANKKLNKALWQLHQHTESWMLLKKRNMSEVEKKYYLAEIYAGLNLPRQFVKKNNEGILLCQKSQLQNPNTLFYCSKLYKQLYFYPDTDKLISNASEIEQIDKFLDLRYCLAKLPLIAESVSRKNVVNEDYSVSNAKRCLFFAENNQDIPFAWLYYRLISLFKNKPDYKSLSALAAVFKKNITTFALDEQRVFFNFLLNLAIQLANAGHKKSQKFLFDLYQYGLQNTLIVINNRITFISYNNIFSAACSLNKLAYAKKFIYSYNHFLPLEIQKDALSLLEAKLFEKLGDYDKVLSHLTKTNFKGLEFKLLGRTLELRSHYELVDKTPNGKSKKKYSFLQSRITAFLKFVKNNRQFSKEKKEAYSNFILYFRNIIKTKGKASSIVFKRKNEYLHTLNDKTFPVVARKWLIEKVIAL